MTSNMFLLAQHQSINEITEYILYDSHCSYFTGNNLKDA